MLKGNLGEFFCDPKWSNNIFTLKHVEYKLIKNSIPDKAVALEQWLFQGKSMSLCSY